MPKSIMLRGWEGVMAREFFEMFTRQMFRLLVKFHGTNDRTWAKAEMVRLFQVEIDRVLDFAE